MKNDDPTFDLADSELEKPRSNSGHVLLLGNDDRVLLAVIRSLGRQGLKVHTSWCDPKIPALSSRYLYAHHALPTFSTLHDTWLLALNQLVENHNFDLIIPCNDNSVLPLQSYRERLTGAGNWYLLDDATFQTSFDKRRTGQLARTLGIPTPRETLVTPNKNGLRSDDGDEIDNSWIATIRYPVYVKPRSSVTLQNVSRKQSVLRATDPAELTSLLAANQESDSFLIQEQFDGIGHGVDVLAFEGQVLIEMQHRRLRETINGGSTYREVVKINPHLSKATIAMVAELDYTGVAMFEFKVDPQTGEYVFLEINARFWGSLPLALAAGVDFPFYLYQMLACGRLDFPQMFQSGVRCRNLVPDLRLIRSTSGVMTLVWHVLTMFFRGDHHDHWAWDDQKPQYRLFLDMARSFAHKLQSKRRP